MPPSKKDELGWYIPGLSSGPARKRIESSCDPPISRDRLTMYFPVTVPFADASIVKPRITRNPSEAPLRTPCASAEAAGKSGERVSPTTWNSKRKFASTTACIPQPASSPVPPRYVQKVVPYPIKYAATKASRPPANTG